MIYYVSFAGEEGFRGGVYIDANDWSDVIPLAWKHNVNPGGEAKIIGPISDDIFVRLAPQSVELFRLYSKVEIYAMDKEK